MEMRGVGSPMQWMGGRARPHTYSTQSGVACEPARASSGHGTRTLFVD